MFIKQTPQIRFSVPGAKHYESRYYSNQPYSFAHLSVTGGHCDCRCEHCNSRLLHSMIPAETPAAMRAVVDRLADRGCKGILLSGGADKRGVVPIGGFGDAIRYARKRGFSVLVHTGIIERETALRLKDCGVHQVLFDVIGHERTIRDVYHLDRKPEDYLRAMMICCETGLDFAPHVVVGLHYGKILGEYTALRMIREAGPKTLVMVILTPLKGTAMSQVEPPSLFDVKTVFAAARIWNPYAFLNLGCAKPAGLYKRQAEKLALDCGFNGIAFPDDAVIEHAVNSGITPDFSEGCCSMAGLLFNQRKWGKHAYRCDHDSSLRQ